MTTASEYESTINRLLQDKERLLAKLAGTDEFVKIRRVTADYRQRLDAINPYVGGCARIDPGVRPSSWFEGISHLRWMLGEIENFTADGRADKVNRWLGFVQGVLWGAGVYSLSELVTHNMPGGEEFHDSHK